MSITLYHTSAGTLSTTAGSATSETPLNTFTDYTGNEGVSITHYILRKRGSAIEVLSPGMAADSNSVNNWHGANTNRGGNWTPGQTYEFLTGSYPATETFTANGTFNVPAGVSSVTVECIGGGGAGGGSTYNGNCKAGGGAGGSYIKKTNLSVTPGGTLAVVVGAGGVASATLTRPGGDSYVGDGSQAIAKGGAGAASYAGSSGGGTGASGSTTGCVGDEGYIFRGGNGGTPASATTVSGAGGGGAGSGGAGGDANVGTSGTGTADGGGNGGAGITTANTRNNGSNYGGGGSGASASSSTDRTGGNGAPGLVKITYLATDSYFGIRSILSGPNGDHIHDFWYGEANPGTLTTDTHQFYTSFGMNSDGFDAWAEHFYGGGSGYAVVTFSNGSAVNINISGVTPTGIGISPIGAVTTSSGAISVNISGVAAVATATAEVGVVATVRNTNIVGIVATAIGESPAGGGTTRAPPLELGLTLPTPAITYGSYPHYKSFYINHYQPGGGSSLSPETTFDGGLLLSDPNNSRGAYLSLRFYIKDGVTETTIFDHATNRTEYGTFRGFYSADLGVYQDGFGYAFEWNGADLRTGGKQLGVEVKMEYAGQTLINKCESPANPGRFPKDKWTFSMGVHFIPDDYTDFGFEVKNGSMYESGPTIWQKSTTDTQTVVGVGYLAEGSVEKIYRSWKYCDTIADVEQSATLLQTYTSQHNDTTEYIDTTPYHEWHLLYAIRTKSDGTKSMPAPIHPMATPYKIISKDAAGTGSYLIGDDYGRMASSVHYWGSPAYTPETYTVEGRDYHGFRVNGRNDNNLYGATATGFWSILAFDQTKDFEVEVLTQQVQYPPNLNDFAGWYIYFNELGYNTITVSNSQADDTMAVFKAGIGRGTNRGILDIGEDPYQWLKLKGEWVASTKTWSFYAKKLSDENWTLITDSVFADRDYPDPIFTYTQWGGSDNTRIAYMKVNKGSFSVASIDASRMASIAQSYLVQRDSAVRAAPVTDNQAYFNLYDGYTTGNIWGPVVTASAGAVSKVLFRGPTNQNANTSITVKFYDGINGNLIPNTVIPNNSTGFVMNRTTGSLTVDFATPVEGYELTPKITLARNSASDPSPVLWFWSVYWDMVAPTQKLSITMPTPEIGGSGLNILGESATATATSTAGTVTAVRNKNITGVASTATGTSGTGVVSTQRQVNLTGVSATATGQSIIGNITVKESIIGESALGVATSSAGVVHISDNIQGIAAIGAGTSVAGTVRAVKNKSITGVVATGSGISPVGVVSTNGNKVIAGVSALGVAQSNIGNITVTESIIGVSALGVASGGIGTVTAQKSLQITGVTATGVATSPSGVVSAGTSVNIIGVAATTSTETTVIYPDWILVDGDYAKHISGKTYIK